MKYNIFLKIFTLDHPQYIVLKTVYKKYKLINNKALSWQNTKISCLIYKLEIHGSQWRELQCTYWILGVKWLRHFQTRTGNVNKEIINYGILFR